jgi:hypothetical protein
MNQHIGANLVARIVVAILGPEDGSWGIVLMAIVGGLAVHSRGCLKRHPDPGKNP